MKSMLSIAGLVVALFAVACALPTPEQWADSQVGSLNSLQSEQDSSLPLMRHRRRDDNDKDNKVKAYSQFRNGRHESSNLDYERKVYEKGDTKVSVYGGVEHRPGHGVGGHTGLRVPFDHHENYLVTDY